MRSFCSNRTMCRTAKPRSERRRCRVATTATIAVTESKATNTIHSDISSFGFGRRRPSPIKSAPGGADVRGVYDYDDWHALSRRLGLKLPNRPVLRFSRPLLATCALLLTAVGVLTWLGYWE